MKRLPSCPISVSVSEIGIGDNSGPGPVRSSAAMRSSSAFLSTQESCRTRDRGWSRRACGRSGGSRAGAWRFGRFLHGPQLLVAEHGFERVIGAQHEDAVEPLLLLDLVGVDREVLVADRPQVAAEPIHQSPRGNRSLPKVFQTPALPRCAELRSLLRCGLERMKHHLLGGRARARSQQPLPLAASVQLIVTSERGNLLANLIALTPALDDLQVGTSPRGLAPTSTSAAPCAGKHKVAIRVRKSKHERSVSWHYVFTQCAQQMEVLCGFLSSPAAPSVEDGLDLQLFEIRNRVSKGECIHRKDLAMTRRARSDGKRKSKSSVSASSVTIVWRLASS